MVNKTCVRCGMEYPNHKMSCKIPVEEWRLPTAEEFRKQYQEDLLLGRVVLDKMLIEFAKLHCEEQLKAILEKVKLKHDYHDDVYDSNYCDKVEAEFCSLRTDGDGMPYAADLINVNKDSILNAYPLDKIK